MAAMDSSTCVISNCLSEYGTRRERVRKANIAIPHGHKLIAGCGNPRCVSSDHAELQKWLSFRPESELRRIASLVSDLPLDGRLDVDFPNDRASLTRLRSYLYQMTIRRCVIRPLSNGKVRIIATGNFSALLGTIKDQKTEKFYPSKSTMACARPHESGMLCGAHYLGMLWGCWEKKVVCKSKCSIKGCPYPATAAAIVCRQHTLAEWQLQYARDLDRHDMIAPREYPWLPLTLYNAPISRDKRGFLDTETYWPQNARWYGAFEKKSAAERINDRWWKANVIDKGLVTDRSGIVHKFDSEIQLNARLEEANWKSSVENIRKFFGVQRSGSLKMRLGGGRGKIRKKQRNRPAGRHGHRDDTKSNKPNRETLEFEDEWESDDPLEDDYSECSEV